MATTGVVVPILALSIKEIMVSVICPFPRSRVARRASSRILACALLAISSSLIFGATIAKAADSELLRMDRPRPNLAFNRFGVHDMGAAPARTTVPLNFVLAYRNNQELQQLIDAQGDPKSPFFRHYLSNAQFNATFAPSPQTYLSVQNVLIQNGFTITKTYDNRTIIEASAAASSVQRFLKVPVRSVFQAGVGLRRMSPIVPAIPASIAPAVQFIVGLDTTSEEKPGYALSKRPPLRQFDMPNSNIRSLNPAISGPTRGPGGTYGPAEIARDFDMPTDYGYTGTGRTIGIITGGNISSSDLNNYQNYFGISRGNAGFYDLNVDGGGKFNPNDGGNSMEATLDIETVVGLANTATIYVATAPAPLTAADTSSSLNAFVSDNYADVVSISYGVCEKSDTNSTGTMNSLGAQAVAKGITLVTEAGDYGWEGCNGTRYQGQLQSPADSQYYVAVGGLSPSAQSSAYTSSVGWSITNEMDTKGVLTAGGGGCSTIESVPTFQGGLHGACGNNRTDPDIALAADPNIGGTPLFFNGGEIGIGGTSWAAPIFAAGQVTIDQETGQRRGNANSALYAAYNTYGYNNENPAIFTDVTVGNNGAQANPGFDQQTGIGIPDFQSGERVQL